MIMKPAPSIKDIDFSFEEAARNRGRERLKGSHRATLASHDPEVRPRKPAWKVVTLAEAEPLWTIERSPGKPAVFTENLPSSCLKVIDRVTGNESKSVFRMKLIESCTIAGQHAAAGDLVTAHAGSAADLIGSGRVEVLEEIRQAK